MSISTITAGSFLWRHNNKPSRRAHTSAVKLFALPNFLAKPTTQLPQLSLIKSQTAAEPNAAFQDPLVLSFDHPCSGFSHLICLITIWFCRLGWEAHKRNSKACKAIDLPRFGFAPLLVKTIWFHCFQTNQRVKKREYSRGCPRHFGRIWDYNLWLSIL